MKATKDHISLETAKLLKDCGVESKYVFSPYNFNEKYKIILRKDIELGNEDIYPAYTWQNILWEYAGLFLESDYETQIILQHLQKKQYDEADEMFKETCVLINKK